MKTKLLLNFLLFFVLANVNAQTFTVDGLNYNITDATNKTVEVGDNSSYAGTAIIPATVTNANNITYKVTAIADKAFALYVYSSLNYNFTTTGIDLSGATNLVSIGDDAFSNCTNLTGSLTIPNSVKSIGNGAFYNCGGFTGNLTLGSSLNTIGYFAFFNCPNFTKVIANNPEAVAINANAKVFHSSNTFYGSDIPLEVPSGAVAAYKEAAVWQDFKSIYEIEAIGLEFIYEGLNYKITNLSPKTVAVADNSDYTGNVVIPATVRYLNDTEYKVTAIADEAFSALDKDEFPLIGLDLSGATNLVSIGKKSFFNQLQISGSLIIPNSVTSIGDGAFAGCIGFTGSLTLPDTLMSIGYAAFGGCTGFTGSLTIPDSVTSIGDSAFAVCTGFTGDLTLGSSLHTIGDSAFYDLTGITHVVVKNSEAVAINANVFQSGEVSSPIFYASNLSLEVPSGAVTAYKEAAVWQDFKSIYEKEAIGVEFIYEGLNYKITDATVKTVEVGHNSDYTGNAVIPATVRYLNDTEYKVTAIADKAFAVYVNNNITQNQNLTGVDLSGATNLVSIGDYAFTFIQKISGSLIIPGAVTSIGEYAFAYNKGFMGSLTLPDTLMSIGYAAFGGCTGFTGSLTIPDSVTSIGDSAFAVCTGFTGDLTLGSSLHTIGNFAFYDLTGITHVVVKNSEAVAINTNVFQLGLESSPTFYGENIHLEVPSGAVAAYKEAAVWQDFKSISEKEVIGVEFIYEGLNYKIIDVSSKTVAVADNTTYTGTVSIPAMVRYPNDAEYKVTSIAQYAFNGNTNITGNLTLGENITSIEGAAFYGCTGLTGALTIPDAVTNIDGAAFSGCTGFTGNLTLGSSLNSIGIYAFYDLTGITNVAVKNSEAVAINANVFQSGEVSSPNFYASDLSLELVNGGLSAYRETPVWKDFKSIIGPTITVGGLVYNIVDTTNHTVELGDNTTYEGVTVSIPETVTDPSTDISYRVIGIAKNAFKDNTHIAYLNITATVGLKSIGEAAFSGCTVLSGVLSLPASVTSIGEKAFSGCVGITSVSVRNSTPVAIQANVFEGLSLSTIPLNVPNAAAKTAYEGTSVWSDFKTISVPGFTVGGLVYTIVDPINYTVEVGDNSSFADSFLSIPDSVTDPNTGSVGDDIDDGGLGGDDGYGGGYDDGFGGGFGDGGYDDGLGDGGDLGDEGGSGITYNVIGISKNAFKNNTNITYLDITTAASLVSIGEGAFSGCSEMTGTLSLPSLVTNIGAFAFDGCTKLSGDLLLPSKVTSIDESAFKNCTGVTSVTVKNPIPVSIQANVFEGLTLGNVQLNVSNGTAIAAYATAAVWKDFSPIVAPTFIFEGLTYNVTDLTNKTVELGDNISYTGSTVTLPATVSNGQTTYKVSSIAKDAFRQNSAITTVDLSGATNLTIIGQESFTGCINLTTVTLPEGLTHIEDFAFGGASALTSIVIPNSVTSLGNAVFTSCSSLTSAVVGNLVTELKSSVFNNCSSLVTVTLGSSVTSIGTYSFSGCTSLKNVIVKNTTPIADLAASVFNALTLDAITLKVPNIASKELYELTSVWEDFSICVSFTANNLDFNITDETSNTVEIGFNSLHNASVVIPATVIFDGIVYKVTAIANDAFKDNTDITSIDLSGATNLRSIGNSAFRNSTNLQTVVIPSTVTSIGDYAFADTTNLEVVVFSEQTSDNSSAKISYQNQANKIVVANSLTSIGAFAFSSSGLTSITIPGTVTSIGERAFKNCNELETVIVENSNPIDISDTNVFEGVILSNVSLIVPNDIAIETYKNTAVWQDFKSIREESTLDIEENVFHKEISLKITENQVEIVHSATIKVNRITVITTLGSLFITIDDSDKINTVSLLRGVYLIKIDTSNGSLVKKFIKL